MPYVNSIEANAPVLIMVALATSLSAPLSSAAPRLCERWPLIIRTSPWAVWSTATHPESAAFTAADH
jgi:hypothetical protein